MKKESRTEKDVKELRVLGYEGVFRSSEELAEAIIKHDWLHDPEGNRSTTELIDSYDQGKAKPLSKLFNEALKGESILALEKIKTNGDTKDVLTRHVNAAVLGVHYITEDGKRFELVERHQEIYRPYRQKDWEVGKMTPTINKRSLHKKQIPEAKLLGVPPLEKVLAAEKFITEDEEIQIDLKNAMARCFVEEILPTLEIVNEAINIVPKKGKLGCTLTLGGEDICFSIGDYGEDLAGLIAVMKSKGIEQYSDFDIFKFFVSLNKGTEFDNVKNVDVLRFAIASQEGIGVGKVEDIDIAKYFIVGGKQTIEKNAQEASRYPNDNWTKTYPGVLSHYIFDVIDFPLKPIFVKESHHLTEYKGDGRIVITIFDWKKALE